MTQPKIIRNILALAGLAAVAAVGSLSAGDYGKVVIDDKAPVEAWTPCDILDKHWFLDQGDGFVKGVRFLGRYHGQWLSVQEDVNDTLNNSFNEYQHRRFRLGMEVLFAHGLSFYAEANIANDRNLTNDYFLNDFQDLFIKWEPEYRSDPKAPAPGFRLNEIRIGKQKQNFTLEDRESSKRIKAVERSTIVNEVAGARPWGAVAEFETGRFTHEIGAWMYGGHLAEPRQLDTGSRWGWSYNVFYELNDTTNLHFDYVFYDNDNGSVARANAPVVYAGTVYEHQFAAGVEVEDGRFQLMSDFVYGANREQTGNFPTYIPSGHDTWGFYFLPSYDITDRLQAVFRYAYMQEGREQRTQRYSVRQRVQDQHTVYVGLQYFICGDKLKLMGGYEWATADQVYSANEIDTGSWLLAFRSYW